jgi:hypothetical protein
VRVLPEPVTNCLVVRMAAVPAEFREAVPRLTEPS